MSQGNEKFRDEDLTDAAARKQTGGKKIRIFGRGLDSIDTDSYIRVVGIFI